MKRGFKFGEKLSLTGTQKPRLKKEKRLENLGKYRLGFGNYKLDRLR